MKQHERRFSSDIFIVYATSKMEDPRWGVGCLVRRENEQEAVKTRDHVGTK